MPTEPSCLQCGCARHYERCRNDNCDASQVTPRYPTEEEVDEFMRMPKELPKKRRTAVSLATETVVCWRCVKEESNPIHDENAHDDCPWWCAEWLRTRGER